MPKRGRVSQEEMDFVRDNRGVYSPEELASRLDRKVETIRSWIEGFDKDSLPQPEVTVPQDGADIRTSRAWQLLKAEFSTDEIGYFMERWGELYEQFREDVAASEKGQLMMAIKQEILIHRILAVQQSAREAVSRLTRQKEEFLQLNGPLRKQWGEDEKAQFEDISIRLTEAVAAVGARTRDLEGHQARHESLMKSLKATREQRISKIESRASFLDLIKRLQVEEEREREGRAMELMRVASEKETRRLGSVHEYADGSSDQPLLNAETVTMLEEET